MSKKAEEVLRRFEAMSGAKGEEQKEHSLRENALERAKNPAHFNAGTAFDWEDLDDYRAELERMEREGPGVRVKKPD